MRTGELEQALLSCAAGHHLLVLSGHLASGLDYWASAGGFLVPSPAGGRDLRSFCLASCALSVLTQLCRQKSPCDPSEEAGVRGGGLPGGCWGPQPGCFPTG